MSDQPNTEVEFPIGSWAALNDFPSIPNMRIVKVLENGYRGTRYLVHPSLIAYGEYHVDELSLVEQDPDEIKTVEDLAARKNFFGNFG